MTNDRTARPVSGEIMSGPPARDQTPASQVAGDVVDADFETGSSRGIAHAASAPTAASVEPVAGMDTLRPDEGPGGARRGGPLFWGFGLTLVVLSFWVSGGHALVTSHDRGTAPAPLAAREMLNIQNVTSRVERAGREMVLLVDGEVLNPGSQDRALPGLSIRVTGTDGTTTRYFLGTNERVLEPGESFAFSSRLAAPKDGVGTVTVDFRREGQE